MTYHLLPELEPFDPIKSGALAKTVAQWMQVDDSVAVASMYTPNAWNYPPERVLVIPGLLKFSRIPHRRFLPFPIVRLFFLRWYAPLLARLQPGDVVWCHHQPYLAVALQSRIKARGAKLIYQAHDARARVKPLKKLKADAWIFGSCAVKDYYLGLFPQWSRTHVMYYGADEAVFYPAAPGTPVNGTPTILYIGRLQAEKGVHLLLEAIRRLTAEGLAVNCRLIGAHFAGGDGAASTYERKLKRLAGPNVTFVGYRSAEAIGEELRQSAIFCCPSIWFEAFGMVNVEAMACGTPVVASRVGGIPEIGSEGGMILFEPGSVEELTQSLRKLIVDPELRQQTGEDGKTAFERRFRWSVIRQHYLEILQQESRSAEPTY